MSSACEICSKDSHNYKCPNCDLKYCSLDCWKTHKESECSKSADKEATARSEPIVAFFPTEDTVDPGKLEELRNSHDLKNILQNPHLRALLREVDSADNAWRAISAAMNEPLFLEFADEVLKIIEPDTESKTEEIPLD